MLIFCVAHTEFATRWQAFAAHRANLIRRVIVKQQRREGLTSSRWRLSTSSLWRCCSSALSRLSSRSYLRSRVRWSTSSFTRAALRMFLARLANLRVLRDSAIQSTATQLWREGWCAVSLAYCQLSMQCTAGVLRVMFEVLVLHSKLVRSTWECKDKSHGTVLDLVGGWQLQAIFGPLSITTHTMLHPP